VRRRQTSGGKPQSSGGVDETTHPEVLAYMEKFFPETDPQELLSELRRLGDAHHQQVRQLFH